MPMPRYHFHLRSKEGLDQQACKAVAELHGGLLRERRDE
jgi:hypothetical protein